MGKLNYKTVKTVLQITTSRNFGELATQTEDGFEEFDIGDSEKAVDDMVSAMQADAYLLTLLSNFNDRQKIILMYQILRESGYNLNHEDCAKTLSLTREHYMSLLKEVRRKAQKIIQE